MFFNLNFILEFLIFCFQNIEFLFNFLNPIFFLLIFSSIIIYLFMVIILKTYLILLFCLKLSKNLFKTWSNLIFCSFLFFLFLSRLLEYTYFFHLWYYPIIYFKCCSIILFSFYFIYFCFNIIYHCYIYYPFNL